MMGTSARGEARALIDRLDEATAEREPERVVTRVKKVLEDAAPSAGQALPDEFLRAGEDRYARRLLHRCDEHGYSVVVMAWGPGQGTRLHDHAGLWCVECVVEGELEVTQYDVIERHGDRYRFARQSAVRATVGDAGCLIPPYEYHVLTNARPDRTSVTIHVYGGEMDHCNLYEPGADGWWTRTPRTLGYD